MLIEKKDLSTNDVACIRLVTGEELLGRVVEVSASSITITKPILLQMQMLNQSQAGLGFAPFMVGCDEDGKFVIQNDKMLVGPMKARKDVASNYLQATTGIQVPTAGGLIK